MVQKLSLSFYKMAGALRGQAADYCLSPNLAKPEPKRLGQVGKIPQVDHLAKIKLSLTRSGKLIVGITGSFGSGKSTAARFFKGLGAGVIDADKLAHKALTKTSPVYPRIANRFPEALDPKGKIIRKKLAGIIFANSRRRRELESLIHPYVFQLIRQKAGKARQSVVAIEVPLLYESGFYRCCHKTVSVSAPRARIAGRLKKKGYAAWEIQARQKAQLPAQAKKKRSDFIVNNAGNFQQTQRQVERIWKSIHPRFQKEK